MKTICVIVVIVNLVFMVVTVIVYLSMVGTEIFKLTLSILLSTDFVST